MTEAQMLEEQPKSGQNISNNTEHAITREQLGRQTWALLHMITGGFPDTFNDILRKKFNTFLVQFGQMYPCKLCANHFMMLLKQEGLFTGNTKVELMTYLCRLHNIVNEKLGHPIHDCSQVATEWNTCGCSDSAKS
jgi:FAD-linked sulfhydryl oxidase